MDLHGKVIKFSEIDKLPKRSAYLDKQLHEKIKKSLNKCKQLKFLPNAIYDEKPMQRWQYDSSKYKLVVFGILEDGQKVSVIIDDIDVYFEVKLKSENVEEEAEEIFEELKMQGQEDFDKFKSLTNSRSVYRDYWKIQPQNYDIVEGKPFKIFQEHMSSYVRIYFLKRAQQKEAIQYMRAKGYETAHDDLTNYFNVVFRDYLLKPGDWWQIDDYTVETSNQYVKETVINVSIKNIINYEGPREIHHKKDYMMTMAWDIETYRSVNDGEVPQPQNSEDNIFLIGMTFQWHHANQQLLRVCLVDYDISPNPDFLTIVCQNEVNLIKAFALVQEKMRPDIIMGFNDSSYDWNWVYERAKKYKLVSYLTDKFDLIKKDRSETDQYYYKSFEVKIAADTAVRGANLQAYGYIPIDVMLIFRKLYATSEKWSLNFFLSENKLGGKEDMPYMEMFRIYRQTRDAALKGSIPQDLLDKMNLVAKYCCVDAQRCHELTNIRNILQDKREVSNISYTSLYDSFYRADGMKVRNLTIANANSRNLKISNISSNSIDQGKYPGAWVFPPKKGLINSKLSISERTEKAKLGYSEYSEWLEVSSDEIQEYYSIIDDLGANPDVNEVEKLSVRKCFKDMLLEETGRPITGLDFSSLYPSLMMTYNISPEYMILDKAFAKEMHASGRHNLHRISFEYNGKNIRAWSIRHDNKLDPNQPDFKFGLFPSILKGLFDTRKKLKSQEDGLGYWEHKIEQIRSLPKDQFESSEVQAEYEDAVFNYNCIDSKQRALKVFMNTYYGEAGNKKSPIYMLEVAGGITSAGRSNIKLAYDFVQSKNCKVYYGDSVTADTPILIRYTKGYNAGIINIVAIEDIDQYIPQSFKTWQSYPQFKPAETEPIRFEKQQIEVFGIEAWTSSGWKPIKRVIRHKTNKKLYRVCTSKGCIDVTEDHSLLSSDKVAIQAAKLNIGQELFHEFPIQSQLIKCDKSMNSGQSAESLMFQTWNVNSKIAIQKIYYNLQLLGVDTQLHYQNGVCTLVPTSLQKKEGRNVVSIQEISRFNNEYVYDLETDDGTFQGGIGSLIVLNTDSLYMATPEQDFHQIDKLYYSDKLDKQQYWSELVNITFKQIRNINDSVNQMFIEETGTKFLKMAFEESLFPVLFTAKKKYVGVPHISTPNFDLTKNKLFIRGLELKKRGVSEILKEVCMDILRNIMSVNNIRTVLEVVEDKLTEVYNTDWSNEFESFVMTAVYKPKVKNIQVQTFCERMRVERGLNIPPGERFRYVIVKKAPFTFDIRGRKVNLSIGDLMEPAEEAKQENQPIDLDYYVSKNINGQLARFIAYHPQFHVDAPENDEEALKQAEKKIYKHAKDYIEDFSKQFYTQYENNGAVLKNVYKKSTSIIKQSLAKKYGGAGQDISLLLSFDTDGQKLLDLLIAKIEANTAKKYQGYGTSYIEQAKKTGTSIAKLNKVYSGKAGLLMKCEALYQERQRVLVTRFNKSLENIKMLYSVHENMIRVLTEKISSTIDQSELEVQKNAVKFSKKEMDSIDLDQVQNDADLLVDQIEQFKSDIGNLRFLYYNLLANYEYIYQIKDIHLQVKAKIVKKYGSDIMSSQEKNNIGQELLQEQLKDL